MSYTYPSVRYLGPAYQDNGAAERKLDRRAAAGPGAHAVGDLDSSAPHVAWFAGRMRGPNAPTPALSVQPSKPTVQAGPATYRVLELTPSAERARAR